MPVTIGSNIAALRIGRLLDESSAALSRNYERLSSGARINRASDDAAGLSVSSALFSKARVLSRAQQNLGDATSLLQIADGALGELSTLVTRMAELAQQAANGTYSSTQRRSLDNEYAQLDREIRRIGASTTFNGLNLLRGSIATNGCKPSQQMLTPLQSHSLFLMMVDSPSSGPETTERRPKPMR